jgi:pimeloyl-ACP methyl ester carboxylesterase
VTALAEGRVTANGVDFAYLEAGSGPLALCLHGFPDSAYSFRHLLPALADAGFHAVAPWTRGYAPTGLPGDGSYNSTVRGQDAIALRDALGGGDDAVVVGHDWGALAAYTSVALQPAVWRRVVTMAVPPMGAVMRAFLSYPQIKRSFYMYFFQTPFADMVVPADDFAFIEGLWRDWSPGYDATEDLTHVKDALRDPANLSAALGYYRAMFEGGPDASDDGPPTLYLHGRDDGCMGADLVEGSEEFLPAGSRAEIIDGAGHFLHLEKPAEVNRLIVDWLTAR